MAPAYARRHFLVALGDLGFAIALFACGLFGASASVTGLAFLAANGVELVASDEECLAMMLGLASAEISEAEFAAWLRERARAA
jgi:hypothetical protein